MAYRYAHVNSSCLEESPTAIWHRRWLAAGGSNQDLVAHVEAGADYDGLAVEWGINNKKGARHLCSQHLSLSVRRAYKGSSVRGISYVATMSVTRSVLRLDHTFSVGCHAYCTSTRHARLAWEAQPGSTLRSQSSNAFAASIEECAQACKDHTPSHGSGTRPVVLCADATWSRAHAIRHLLRCKIYPCKCLQM